MFRIIKRIMPFWKVSVEGIFIIFLNWVRFDPVVSAGNSPNNLDFQYISWFWPCSFCSFYLEALDFRYVCVYLYVVCILSQEDSKNSGGYVRFQPVVSVDSAGDSPNNLDFRYMRSFLPCSFCWELSQQFRFLIYVFVLTL